ncbi:LAQU0S15e02674g1_1 [Lachancea quebecensis]|uniref:DNA repair protein RAD50 n=1 Tax=Lachancea quebecensis TaxID=1654605 RepID=A0A0P1KWM6_9SACH|nr:LAQU0S15e02674g1_1 [Lachancea quebecensis]
MSAIYKLSIQGIRSFDSNERETIEFGKPLTLIVGTNGSGKTTIIECLKYATTGDLPPNSKGGAFIHDPKITGEKDVRAQVKLAFMSPNDVNMIVTRNIQLLVKKTTNTFKTLEGQLVAINRGERTTLSSRAAELDIQVPLYMGVPKAILDYVVFCHQEDSLWPLSEPSNLKKRFDEIFQAMKYTKALDNLKAIKKDMSVEIKLLKQSVEHLKVDRDRSRATKINISTLEKRIDEYKEQARQVEEQLDEITEQSDKLFKSNQEFQEVLSRMDGLRHSKNSLEEQIIRLEGTTEVLNIPKVELEKLVANFSSTLEEKQSQVQELDNILVSKRHSLDETRERYNTLTSRQGELNARKSSNQDQIKELDTLEVELREQAGISGPDIFTNLENKVHSSNSHYELMIAQSRQRIESLRHQISELQSARAKQEQHLIYCGNDKNKLASEIDSLGSKLKTMSNLEEELVKEEDKMNSFKTRLSTHETEDEINSIGSQIKEKNASILLMEDDLEKNQRELLKVNEQADLSAKYSLIQQSLNKKKSEVDNLVSKVAADKRAQEWNLSLESDLEFEFRKAHINLQKEFALLTQENIKTTKNLAEKEFLLAQLRREKDINDERLGKLNKKITEGLPEDCSIDDYTTVVEETEESYRVAVENLKMHKTTLEFNLKALEVAKESNCCYLCQRKFHDAREQSTLLQELQSRTDTKFEETLTKIVEEEKEYLHSLRKLENDVSSVKNLKESQEAISLKYEEASKDLQQKSSEAADSDSKVQKVKRDIEYTETVLRPLVENLSRVAKELKALESEFQNISDEVRVRNGLENNFKTVDELQSVQKRLNDSLRVARKDIGLLQETKETKSREYNNLLGLIREKAFKVDELKKQLKDRENIKNTIEDRKSAISQTNTIIQTVSSTLTDLSANIDEAKNKLSLVSAEANAEEVKVKRELDSLRSKRDRYAMLRSHIKDFEDKYAPQLENCQNEIESSREMIHSLTSEVESLGNRLREQNQKVRDSANEQKNLRLNIDLVNLKLKLTKVEKDLRDLHVQNAEAQRDKYQQESTRLRSLFEKLSSDNAGRMGEIKQLQNQISSLIDQLNTDYKDVDNIYQKEWVQLQTKTLVTDDIDVYSKALDSAIMKYHSLKMHDINRIIDELWKRTYSGTDVDTIKIKSDEVTTSTRGKSYNYRVVMYKQDAELDMRGRCSAGQKVLASIIIRLALSETFGVNCGVIALDEPTTNLDEENIESLAKSLNNIIEFRRHQKNFQLIVITHDEKFLRYMGAADFTDHFYKVKRDDRQKSQIEWVDINKVTD